MALETTENRKEYSGNGVTVNFSFPYYFLKEEDLVVILVDDLTAVEDPQVLTTDYTIAGEGVESGGTVTMLVAPPSGKTLVVYRDPAKIQEKDFRENDSFPAEQVEEALDLLTMIAQRQGELLDRSVKLSDGFVGTFDLTLPSDIGTDSAGKMVIVNPTEDGFVMGPNADDIPLAEGYAEAAGDSAAAAALSQSAAAASAIAAAASAGSFISNAPYEMINLGISASVSANALTVRLKQADGTTDPSTGGAAVKIGFRSSTAANGAVIERSVTGALSIVIPAATGIGGSSGIDEFLYVYAIDNAGTVELALSFDGVVYDNQRVSSIAISGGDQANVLYSTTARSGVACRMIGRLKIQEAALGFWATAPSEISAGKFSPYSEKPTEIVASAFAKNGMTYFINPAVAGIDLLVPSLPAGKFSFKVKYTVNGSVPQVSIYDPLFVSLIDGDTAKTLNKVMGGCEITAINGNYFTLTTNAASNWRPVAYLNAGHVAAKVAGTYNLTAAGDPTAVSGTGTLYPQGLIRITTSDYASIGGAQVKMRIRAQLLVNDVAPTGNFTFGLYPVTRPGTSGGTALNILTLGTVVAGTNGASFTAPAADSMAEAISAVFDVPTTGFYTIGVLTTATVAANSLVWLYAQLEVVNS